MTTLTKTTGNCLPISPLYDSSDAELIDLIRIDNGKAAALLIERHRSYILRLVKQHVKPAHAEDVTQDVLMKVFINIRKFERRSLFTTWLYRITLNHVLHYHKTTESSLVFVDTIDSNSKREGEVDMEAKEANYNVLLGMTLCMDAEQRMTITLADIFKLDHKASGTIMNISAMSFRKRLSRSRKELRNFLSNQCSLMNSAGSCKCKSKYLTFVEKGWVNESTRTFRKEYVNAAEERFTAWDKC